MRSETYTRIYEYSSLPSMFLFHPVFFFLFFLRQFLYIELPFSETYPEAEYSAKEFCQNEDSGLRTVTFLERTSIFKESNVTPSSIWNPYFTSFQILKHSCLQGCLFSKIFSHILVQVFLRCFWSLQNFLEVSKSQISNFRKVLFTRLYKA